MKLNPAIAIVTIAAALGWQAEAQIYETNNVVVQTFAGSGFSGYVDGVGELTMFNDPSRLLSDSSGNLFVWDNGNARLRKIKPDGTVSTFAGGGNQTTGVGTNVAFLTFDCMTIDRSDNIWAIFHPGGYPVYLYKITSNGTVTRTILPRPLSISIPLGMCIDSVGNLYSSETDGRIYRYSTNGVLSVFAGSGNYGYADGNGIFTSFKIPQCLAADSANNIYVWDSYNYLIRRIDQSQNVTTFAGSLGIGELPFQAIDGVGASAVLHGVTQMCFDGSGNLILAGTTSVRKISPAKSVTTFAGSFSQFGYANGSGSFARFYGASGVCVSQGAIFVADNFNQRIRQITFNQPPVIQRQPQGQVSCLGQSASFRVTATGVQPLSYQWLHNNVALGGQTSTNLMLSNLVANQAGAYSVIVSNPAGTVTSAPSQLVVNDACVDLRMYAGLKITGQPGASYVLSYTTNLDAQNSWMPVATNIMPASGWFYLDMESAFSGYRFYRVTLQR